MMAWSHLKADPRIVRAFIDKSGDTVAWLERMGVYFYCVPHSPWDNPRTWHVPNGNGAEILKALAETAGRLGVEVITQATATALIRNRAGRITRVKVTGEDGVTDVPADAVVIATGGFAGDKEMMKKLCPDYREELHRSGLPNMGEGIAMAFEAGAARDGLGYLMAGGPIAGGIVNLGPDKVKVNLGFISGEPFSLWVNQRGERFIDETEAFNYYRCINALLRQPGTSCYALLDAAMIEEINRTGLTNLAEGYGYGAIQRSPLPPGLAEAIRQDAENGRNKVADGWDEMATWIGADPAVLKATVEEYNSHCDRGYDPVFGKAHGYLQPLRTPPYYAFASGGSILNTMGGLKINERMEVLDRQGAAIPGLYAAGVDTGGWTGDTYCADLPGTAFGYAVNSGRIAGESVARLFQSLRRAVQ
jgi:fumarate reductase flavoprotein subunit